MEIIQKIVNKITKKQVLFRLGDYVFLTYGLIIAATMFFAFFLATIILQIFQINQDMIFWWIIITIISTLLGSLVFTLILDFKSVIKDPKNAIHNGWFSFLGGFLGFWFGSLPLVLYYNISILRFSDALLLFLPFFHFFGRFACINNGCCSCRLKTSHKGLYFSYESEYARAVKNYNLKGRRLCPVHIDEMIANLCLGLFLLFLLFFVSYHGLISVCYFFGYGLIRLILDPKRAEEKKVLFGKFSLYLILLVLIYFSFGFSYLYAFLNNSVPIEIHFETQYILNSLYFIPIILIMSIISFFFYSTNKYEKDTKSVKTS
jgi:prolipoprotein diacylglyceryltransferase